MDKILSTAAGFVVVWKVSRMMTVPMKEIPGDWKVMRITALVVAVVGAVAVVSWLLKISLINLLALGRIWGGGF